MPDELDIQQALEIMAPYMEMGVLLERIWPPCDAPKGWLSQLGGWPNLPADWEWPRIAFAGAGEASLDFVAQVDLKTLPSIPTRNLLPSSGTLYFFVLAEAPMPLEEFGPQSWRVLHYPGDASVFPPRQPPADAAWNLEDLDHSQPCAEEMRDPDGPRWNLFPRCPVRAMPIKTWDYRYRGRNSQGVSSTEVERIRSAFDIVEALDQRTPPPPTDFAFDHLRDDALTRHVEDALLSLNRWRNDWFEGLVALDDVLNGQPWRFERSRGGPEAARDDYLRRLPLVRSFAQQLKASGRKAVLTSAQRETLGSLTRGVLFPRFNSEAVITSLATLLVDYPEVAQERAEEVKAAHPSYLDFQDHRMLGHEELVQSTHFDEPAVMLLQLDSDIHGPRFQWWDMGKLTFWISPEALADRQFHLAKAEIEGH